MPVGKITADQFVTRLNKGIQDRNSSYDVDIGPIPDIITQPTAQVLENQNDNIVKTYNLITLNQFETFDDIDVENFVYNEALIRNEGGRSSGVVTFARATPPSVDITVQRGFPIATSPDEETGATVVFVTTEEKTMFTITAPSYFNITTGKYELTVAVQCVITGAAGEVGADKIQRPLRPLSNFDSVTNTSRTSPANERETNAKLIDRYKTSIIGTQVATRGGLQLFVATRFPDAGSVLVVNSDDPLVTRTGIAGNAVDIFVNGSQSTTRQENYEFLAQEQLIVLVNQPALSIIDIAGYTAGVDYEFVKDTSGISNSVRAQDGVKFLAGGSSPAVGAAFPIKYEQSLLIENIQNSLDDPDLDVGGQDALVRLGAQVDVTISATLTVISGFSFTTIKNAATTAILSYINELSLGADVEKSDINGQARQISGVDNFVFTVFDRVGGTGNTDIIISKNEFPRISSGDLIIS
jgi:uncharacterized phage protein gp47/JayE